MIKRQATKFKAAIKKQGSFLLRLLFTETLTIIALLTFAAYAQGQSPYTLTVSHNATGRGVVSGGCAALIAITGDEFISEPARATLPTLPYQLGGVTVTVDNQPAVMWFVGTDKIRFIAPYLQTPIKKRRLNWYQIVVRTPTNTYSGWTAYAPTAPGIYEQVTNGTRHPQGLYQDAANPFFVSAISDAPFPAGARLALAGTGFRNADKVRVWIDDGYDLWIVDGTMTPDPVNSLVGWNGFPWIEMVGLQLPADARGNLVLVVQAGEMWSQEVFLSVAMRPSLP